MPQYKFRFPFGGFKAGDTTDDAGLAKAGLSPNVLAKDGYVEVDGEMITASTSYAPNNPGDTSPAAAASPAKPFNATDTDH